MIAVTAIGIGFGYWVLIFFVLPPIADKIGAMLKGNAK